MKIFYFTLSGQVGFSGSINLAKTPLVFGISRLYFGDLSEDI